MKNNNLGEWDIFGMKTPRTVKLKTPFDIQRLLAKLVNRMLRNEIGEAKASKIAYICTVMLKTFESGEFEERINKLENKIAEEK